HFQSHQQHHILLSFPTRRSSDLAEVHVPIYRDEDGIFQMPIVEGAQPSEVGEDTAIFHVGSGEWRFLSPFSQSETMTTLEASLRSEEHTSELQSRFDLVCRLLLE